MMVENELTELGDFIAQFQQGKITRAELRSHSAHYGVYPQRQSDSFFVRVRVPNGMISPGQMTALASAVDTWGKGECHLTTRQGIEIHELALDHVPPFLRALADADLSSHESGGNTVRGIVVCPHAGMWSDEPFDVTSYADLLTRHFLRHPDYQGLPRKVKIGFSCCEDDCAQTSLQDLGFQACSRTVDGPGFRVLVGGGMGNLPRLGQLLMDFLPAGQLLPFTDAFLRVFNRLGDRKHRGRARVRFLIRSLGSERFRQEILDEWNALKHRTPAYLERRLAIDRPNFPPEVEPGSIEAPETGSDKDPEWLDWMTTRVQSKPNNEFRLIRVPLSCGFATSSQLRQLAGLAELHGLAIRTTPEQGFVLRWVRPALLFQIYRGLEKAKLLEPPSDYRVVACPGSSLCSNAFTNTRALAAALSARLAANGGVKQIVRQWRIRLSGCPNGCALQGIADVGLEGIANREGEDWVPAYRLWVGGVANQQEPRLGANVGMIPAAKVPDCLNDLAAFFQQARQPQETLAEFTQRVGTDAVKAVVQKYQLSLKQDRQACVFDFGDATRYHPPEKGRAVPC